MQISLSPGLKNITHKEIYKSIKVKSTTTTTSSTTKSVPKYIPSNERAFPKSKKDEYNDIPLIKLKKDEFNKYYQETKKIGFFENELDQIDIINTLSLITAFKIKIFVLYIAPHYYEFILQRKYDNLMEFKNEPLAFDYIITHLNFDKREVIVIVDKNKKLVNFIYEGKREITYEDFILVSFNEWFKKIYIFNPEYLNYLNIGFQYYFKKCEFKYKGMNVLAIFEILTSGLDIRDIEKYTFSHVKYDSFILWRFKKYFNF